MSRLDAPSEDPAGVLVQSARQLREVLADVDAGRLACSRGMQNRIEGAVLTLDRWQLDRVLSDDAGVCGTLREM